MNKMKLYFQRFLQIAVLLLGVVLIYQGLDYLLTDDTSSQTRVTFHDYYAEGDIDYLFMGPSHSVHSINAVALSEKLDANVFNLSTTGQDLKHTYYLLLDAFSSKKIGGVFFELSLSRLKVQSPGGVNTYLVADYMKSQYYRAAMLLDYSSDKYINSFFRLRRNIDPMNLPKWEKIQRIWEKKHTAEYRGYVGSGYYMGKGQYNAVRSLSHNNTMIYYKNTGTIDHFTMENTKAVAWGYLQKIMDLCKERGVKLTLFITPYTEPFIYEMEGYMPITERVMQMAAENDVPLVDLNLVKKEYLPIQPGDFYNMDHVRAATSDKIADFFAAYIRNPSGDWFTTYSEAYPSTDGIIGICYDRLFVTDKGTYKDATKAEGDINTVQYDVFAYSRNEIEAEARIWKVECEEEGSDVWTEVNEIRGEALDAYTTRFVIPYDEFTSTFKVQLLEPGTGKLMYESIAELDME